MTKACTTSDFASLEAELAPLLQRVEDVLKQQTTDPRGILTELLGHLAQAGGKRMRPLLVLLCSALGKADPDRVVAAAAAVELTHLATLYHDDVMDSAPSRRGVDAVHMVWSNNQAILAGDLIFARASALVSELGPRAVRQHAQTFGRLCQGQLDETAGVPDGQDAIEFYLRVLADKTGSLVAQSARFGAELAGADEQVVDALYRFGDKTGVAFQIADDVLDIDSDHEMSGKTPGTDLREGVDTLPVLLLRRDLAQGSADEDARHILAFIGEEDLSDDAALEALVQALRKHPVLGRTRQLARRWADDAKAELAVVPEGRVKRALEAFSDMLVDRVS